METGGTVTSSVVQSGNGDKGLAQFPGDNAAQRTEHRTDHCAGRFVYAGDGRCVAGVEPPNVSDWCRTRSTMSGVWKRSMSARMAETGGNRETSLSSPWAPNSCTKASRQSGPKGCSYPKPKRARASPR